MEEVCRHSCVCVLRMNPLLTSRPPSRPCSLPLAVDLMETCIDDVLRAPAVAAEDAGPSGAFAGSSVGAASIAGDDPLSLSGEPGPLKCLHNKTKLLKSH